MSNEDVNWLITSFVDNTPGVVEAIVVSSDGLLMSMSRGLDRAGGDRFAAVASGLIGLAYGAATERVPSWSPPDSAVCGDRWPDACRRGHSVRGIGANHATRTRSHAARRLRATRHPSDGGNPDRRCRTLRPPSSSGGCDQSSGRRPERGRTRADKGDDQQQGRYDNSREGA